jgi:aspartate/methionine/tyrosine aminotransferase
LQENILNQNNHGYCGSTGIPEFRNSIKGLYNPKFPIELSDIHVNHGVNMGLLAVLLAFTNEGDEILVPELGYPFYQDVCPALKRKAVPYKLKKDSNFEIDLE